MDLDDARLERHGRLLVWHLADGRLIPVPAGAAGSDDDDQDDDDSSDDTDEDADSEDGGGDEDADSDDVEKVRAALAKERRERRAADKRARTAERRTAELEKSTKSKPKGKGAAKRSSDAADDDGEDDVEARIEAAREEAREEADQRNRHDLVAARVEALAADRLADPTDAPLHLADDLDDLVDDRGRPDRDAIRRAIDDLLDDKPHLAKRSGDTDDEDGGRKRRPRGATDQGARGASKRGVHERAKERAERMKTLR